MAVTFFCYVLLEHIPIFINAYLHLDENLTTFFIHSNSYLLFVCSYFDKDHFLITQSKLHIDFLEKFEVFWLFHLKI